MPITIEHGGQAGPAAGQIIAQAGLVNLQLQAQQERLLQQLQQQREMQMQTIQAQADRQKQAAEEATAQTAQRFGLQGQLQSQAALAKEKEIQQKAEFDAANFEKQYTIKQRLDIAKWSRIKQDIDMNPNFSEQEREAVKRAADLEIMGIKPSELPKTTPWEKGKGIGESWKDADGSLIGRDPDGRLRLIQRWDQGPDAQSMKEQQDSVKAQAKLQVDLEKEKRKGVFELMSKGIFDGVDEFGKPKMRRVDAREARTIVDQLYSEQQQGGEGWAQQAEKAGMTVQDADRSLPPNVGYAKTYVQNMRGMYGEFKNFPPEAKDAYREAIDIIREYARQQ